MSALQNAYRAGQRLYRRLFRQHLDARTKSVARTLKRIPALETMSKRAVLAMAECVHRRTYRRGESIYYEGDPGLGLYVLETGRVRLLTEPEPGLTQEVRTVEAPALFGALCLLGEFERMETAEAVDETEVLGFFRPDLKNVSKRDPKAGAEITTTLGQWVAARHMDLVERMAERSGHEAALQAYVDVGAGTS